MARFFPYAYEERLQLLWRPFGLRADRDGVHVDEERFVATFGRLRLETARENVAGAHVTRDYRWWTAVGARLSLVDDGLTFGTTTVAGSSVGTGSVLIRRPTKGAPWGCSTRSWGCWARAEEART